MKIFLRYRLLTLLLGLFYLYLVSCSTVPARTELSNTETMLPSEAFFPEWTFAAEGLELLSFSTENPWFHISAVRVDLTVPEREIVVSQGILPLSEGNTGKNNFRSRRIEQFMDSEKLLAAINATPFGEYRLFAGLRQTAVGTVFSGGIMFSVNSKYDAVVITKDRRVYFATPPFPAADKISALAGGFFIILKDGKNIAGESPRDARSLAGTSDGGKVLILAVIDGKNGGTGKGATFRESSEWLKALGADNGMLLDGGGSSILAVRGREDGVATILNNPERGVFSFIQRNVPVFLGVR